jgi:hypothetical protein
MTSRRATDAVVSRPARFRRARRGGESAAARRESPISRVGVERIAALTSLSAETLERLDADSLDARRVVARLVLLRALVPEGDVSHMIAVEPRLLSQRAGDEDFERGARDALEALERRVRWDNVRKFLIEREPGLLLGDGGSRRLDEIGDFASEHEANLSAVAGDGTSWLDVGGQRFVENFLVRYYD